MSAPSVIDLDRLDLRYEPWPWPFAVERRAEIDQHFAQLQAEKPALWNGRVLLMHDHAIADGALTGAFFETDFASFLAWRDWGFPDLSIRNCFAMGALRGSDGAFVLGEMAPHTANAGRIYFPAGTPDPNDVVANTVDLAGSVAREVAEETGLAPELFAADQGWRAICVGPRIALIKILNARVPAVTLRAEILRSLEHDPQPELSDIHIVRDLSGLDPAMPDFVKAFFVDLWG